MDTNKYLYTAISAIILGGLVLFTKVGKDKKRATINIDNLLPLTPRQVKPIKVNVPDLPVITYTAQIVATKGEGEKPKPIPKPKPKLKVKPKSTQQRILDICYSLNGKLEVINNDGKEVEEILTFNKLPTGLAYCGATVAFVLNKAGVDYNVYRPYWASNNFIDKSKIVYDKGKWYIDQDSLKIGYVTGYKLGGYGSTHRINHVGLYMAHAKYNQELFSTTKDKFKVFEGNTSNPNNPKQQGLFFKDRPFNITLIRRYD